LRTAGTVVVGGGVIGASVAHHLAAAGVHDIVILERGAKPGAGSTGVATGGFRASFASPIDVRLSLLARESLHRFADETGVDPGYLPAGYLWLATSEAEREALRRALRVQRAEGLREAVEVTSDEIARLNPALRPGEILSGLFCPTDGFIRPMKILEGYLAAAQRRGVRVEWGVEVTSVRRSMKGLAGPITALETTTGPIAVGAVVNAAGAWAGTFAALAGIDLPVMPLRRQVASTEPFDGLPETMPMTIFVGDGFHFRVRDGRVLLLWPRERDDRAHQQDHPPTQDPFDRRVDPDWVAGVLAEARRRAPVLASAAIDPAACRAGLYEMTPDRHAILGALHGCANLYFANGASGHGVMHAPALGRLLAEIMTTGAARSLDVAPLRPSRFAEGELTVSAELL
jgi:sarcosine oxidase subunit beta